MGIGNYIPQTYGEAEQFYVEIPSFDDEDELMNQFELDDWYKTLDDTILETLTNTFHFHNDKARDIYKVSEWLNRRRVIASNSLVSVTMADNQWSVAIVIETNMDEGEENYGIAVSQIVPLWRKLLTKLLTEQYGCFCRTSAWTSGQYKLNQKGELDDD